MAWYRRREQPSSPEDSAPPNIQIDPALVVENVRILIDEQLGSGGYGAVYLGDWCGTPVAVKRVHSALVDDQVATEHRNAFLENFAGEWRLYGHLRHPFIVQFIGVYQPRSRNPSLVMELMDQTLRRRCQRSPYLSDDVTVRLCGEVLCALVYLHGRGIIHRDLTTNNVLLTRGSEPVAKISDLGVARALFGDDPRRRVQLSQSRGMTRGPGAVLYMSPESVDNSGRPYDTKHDVFSFGVLALSTSIRREPACFEEPRRVPLGDGSRKTRVVPEVERRAADLDDLPPAHPLRRIILKCLQDSPLERPAASEILAELEHLPAVASTPAAPREDDDGQNLRGELARVRQELQASERRSRQSADRERAAQEQVQLLQNQLTSAQQAGRRSQESAERECAEMQEQIRQLQQQLTAANERVRTAAEEYDQSRRVLEEVLSQQDQCVTTTPPSTTSPRVDITAAATPVNVRPLSSYRWKTLQDIPGDGKSYHRTVHFGEWIVLVGGIDKYEIPCRRVYAYNLRSGQWTESARTPFALSSAASDGQHLYVIGGSNKGSAVRCTYRVSHIKDLWVNMPDLPHAVCHSAATICKGKLFVHGGDDKDEGRLQVFDFSKHSWAVLSSDRISIHPTKRPNKYTLVSWDDYLVSFALQCYYNTVSNKWHSLPCRNTGETGALAVVNNVLIAVGAYMRNASDSDQHAVDVLESVYSNWSSHLLPRLPSPRCGASACTVDNSLFVTGGFKTQNKFLCLS